jgi:hypothetical protein
MSIKEIVTKVLASNDGVVTTSLFYGGFRQKESTSESARTKRFNQELLDAELVVEYAQQFGGEEQGDYCWSVYKFAKGSEFCHVKFDGYYSSYSGSEFEEWFFVEPKEVMVIEWAVTK